MSTELITILENIEKDKGIRKDILIAAVEAALISAARKILGVDKEKEVTVKLDVNSGTFKIFSDGKEIESKEFGRISAQTAKQVIIQKLREAERDVIYEDFSNKIGSIVTGSVHRFEKGDIIVDLGKTEGVLTKKERLPKEEYKIGQRVKAYVVEARKTGKGPQVVLSRTHPNFVKKLFELEVPEIYEGIVEIKSVSREPGERAKIAVSSNEEKVDCVGACVGMRGSRVKNVVQELHGEKIDIVRWSPNISDFVSAALSPAKVSNISVDKDVKKVEVLVEDDQLSLAIGKKGQNVRLAVKLTGWDIDIRPKNKKPEGETAVIEEAAAGSESTSVEELDGVGEKTAQHLLDAGFGSAEAIAESGVEKLTEVKGIGKKTAEKILEAAKEALAKRKEEKTKEESGGEKSE